MKILISEAITAIKSDAKFVVFNEDVNKIEWHDGNPTNITNEQILNKKYELQLLENVYKDRRKEYGSLESQLDEIYHNGLDSWKARIANIKLNNPKE
jgi:hypothetical protein